jgi:iron(III) transport system permease protein
MTALRWSWVGFLALVCLAPIAGLFSQAQSAAFFEILDSKWFLKSLSVTLVSGLGGAAISVFFGMLLARPFALFFWKGQRLERLVLLFPYLIPNFILASAYVTGWNPTSGLLSDVLPFPGGLYGLGGMTWIFGVAHLPIAFLMAEERFRKIDPALREAAQLSGASGRRVFRKIELPLLTPTLAGAFGLCFSLNLSAFAIPAWIGAPERVYPLSYKIFQSIQVGGIEGLPQAAVLSMVLFGITLFPYFMIRKLQSAQESVRLISGKVARASGSSWKWRESALFRSFFWILQLLFWILPMGSLFLSTWVKPGCLQQEGLTCFLEPTARAYTYVIFELQETALAAQGSLGYGTLSAISILLIAIASLIFLAKSRLALQISEWIFSVPLSTPGAILALGLIVVASGRFGINLYNTPWIVVAAFLIKHLSLAFQPLRAGYAAISESLTEAAQLSGASRARIWGRIILPILRPEWMGGFFLVLIPILGELTMSIFLASPSFRSFGTVLFDLQDYADQASAAALSILLVVVVLFLNQLAYSLSRGKLGY